MAFEMQWRKAGVEKHVQNPWNLFVLVCCRRYSKKVHLNEKESSMGWMRYCKYDLEECNEETD